MVAGSVGPPQSSTREDISYSTGVRSDTTTGPRDNETTEAGISRSLHVRAADARSFSWFNQSPQGRRQVVGGRSNFA